MLNKCYFCVFFVVFVQVYRKTPHELCGFVVFKQTCSKCAFSHKHISSHRLMNNIYIYLTLSFKELIEGRRYFEIRKKFVLHCELFAIKNSGCYSDFGIPLSRAWNTTVWDKYHSSQPIKLKDFIEPCYNRERFWIFEKRQYDWLSVWNGSGGGLQQTLVLGERVTRDTKTRMCERLYF